MIENKFFGKKETEIKKTEIEELEFKLNSYVNPENKGKLFMKYEKGKGFLAVLLCKNIEPSYVFFRDDKVYQEAINYKKEKSFK